MRFLPFLSNATTLWELIMTEKEKQQRIKDLEKQIIYHQDLYYNKQPEITDEAFDFLWDELQKLDPNNALFKKVGADSLTGFAKVEHIIPMGSQEKAANPNAFLQWANKMTFSYFIVQHKLDGASLELQYKNGLFVKGVTRGNGIVGDDITENVKKMQGLVFELKYNGVLIDFTGGIRGEVILKRSVHKAYYSDKANCRNACNGIMKRKDGLGCEHLTIICYDALQKQDPFSLPYMSNYFSSEEEKLKWLSHLGFTTVNQHICKSAQEVIDYREKVMQERTLLDYDIDGLVVKGNELDLQDAAKPRPDKQIAFKFSLEQATSTLLDIEWSESGATYTPIAIIEPVRLAGTTVKRASLANPKIISGLGLKIGSKVLVTKRGEIIPKIEGLVFQPDDAREIILPHICSSCGSSLVNDLTRLYCPKSSCKKLLYHRLEKWVSVLNIQELGTKLLKQLFELDLVTTISDLYKLEVSQLIKLDRMGKLSAEKVMYSINSHRTISLSTFIAGFDIEGIGVLMAEKLVGAGYTTLSKLLQATEEELARIPNFGEILAHQLVQGLQNVQKEMIFLLDSKTITLIDTTSSENLVLSGMSFCFTGELVSLKGAQAEELVKRAGGLVKSSVTKDLTYLVTNEPESGSAKNRKAKELAIKIIDEKQFLNLIEER